MRQRLIDMRVYVASADGEIVGTIASSFTGEAGHLRGMAVDPAWQGHGIAEQLLLTAEKDLLASGCTRVNLDTTIPLQRAIRFYQKNGFVPTGSSAISSVCPCTNFPSHSDRLNQPPVGWSALLAHTRARSRSRVRSRALPVSAAAFSNSARASSNRPSLLSSSPRTLGKR
jgi:hypothetical protein